MVKYFNYPVYNNDKTIFKINKLQGFQGKVLVEYDIYGIIEAVKEYILIYNDNENLVSRFYKKKGR